MAKSSRRDVAFAVLHGAVWLLLLVLVGTAEFAIVGIMSGVGNDPKQGAGLVTAPLVPIAVGLAGASLLLNSWFEWRRRRAEVRIDLAGLLPGETAIVELPNGATLAVRIDGRGADQIVTPAAIYPLDAVRRVGPPHEMDAGVGLSPAGCSARDAARADRGAAS